ncbi:MAG: 4Fe-4S binding protein [Promethearchaeia archaeon]
MSDKKINLKEKKVTIARRIVQTIAFLLINYVIIELIFSINLKGFEGFIKILPILNSPRNPLSDGAGMLEYIYYFFIEGVFPFFISGALILILLFTNRFFCGWVCPIGFIQDLLCKIPKETKRVSIENHNSLVKLKYLIVILITIIIVPLGVTKLTDLVFYFQYKQNLGQMAQKPLGYFSLSEFIFVFLPDLFGQIWEAAELSPLFSDWFIFLYFAFYIIVLIITVYYPRAYCRYICPFGGVASAVSDYSFVTLSRSPVKCVGRKKCGVCERVCPKQIRILDEPFEFFTGSGECNMCLECLESCPYDAIKIKMK